MNNKAILRLKNQKYRLIFAFKFLPIMSDSQIIQQLKDRNQQAIAEILKKYGNALYGIIYREVSKESLAIDTMNTLCLEVWNNAQKFDNKKEQLFTWLTKLVYKILSEYNHLSVENRYPNSLLDKLKAA